jgi:hypothetical protein
MQMAILGDARGTAKSFSGYFAVWPLRYLWMRLIDRASSTRWRTSSFTTSNPLQKWGGLFCGTKGYRLPPKTAPAARAGPAANVIGAQTEKIGQQP